VGPCWAIQYVQPENHDGSLVSVVSFNNQNSFIVVHQACWAVVHMGRLISHIFGPAMDLLKQLPSRPSDHQPYRDHMAGSRLRVLVTKETTRETASPDDPASAGRLQ
jgi:hypothetical protein